MPWRKVISRCRDRARQAHVRRFVGWSGRASLIRGHLSQTWRKWKSQPYRDLGRRAFQVASAKFLKWVQCWCIWGRIRRICRWGRGAKKGMSERKYVDMTLGACGNDLLIASISSVRMRMEQKESGIWRDVQLRQWTVNGFEQIVIPRNNSINIIWECVKNANFGASSQICWIRNSGGEGKQSGFLTSPLGYSNVQKVWELLE